MSWDVSNIQRVIGIVGQKAAGKGAASARLAEKHGFTVLTFSTPIREVATKELGTDVYGKSVYTVADLVRIADRERKANGPGYWATQLIRIAVERQAATICVDGIRNEGEIEALRAIIGPARLELWGITGRLTVRYQRAGLRNQQGDPVGLEGFIDMDDVDRGIGQPSHGQQVDRCLARVPYENLFDNSGELEGLIAWVDKKVAM